MMTFDELIATNPPRLVVEFQHGPNGDEQFKWGIVGEMPMLTLIGAVVRAQVLITTGDALAERIDPPTLVMAYHKEYREFSYFLNFGIPHESLLGMLETIKAVLVGSRLAAQSREVISPIVGMDGKPLRR